MNETVSIRIVLRRKLYDWVEKEADRQNTRPNCLLEECLEDGINRRQHPDSSPSPNYYQKLLTETAVTSCAMED